MGILDPLPLGIKQATSLFGPKKATPRNVVIFGDSITDICGGPRLNGTVQDFKASGYWTWANIFASQRFNLLVNAGVSGDDLTHMLARIDADVLAYKPDIVVVAGGINHVGRIPTVMTLAQELVRAKNAYTAILDKLHAQGIIAVVTTMNPTANNYWSGGPMNSDQKKFWSQFNEYIRQQAFNRPGVVLADFAVAFADPSLVAEPFYVNNGYPAYLNDGLHDASAGALLKGQLLANAMIPLCPLVNILHHGIGDANKLVNGSFTGASGTTKPTSWTASDLSGATDQATYDYALRTDGIAGSWLRYTNTSASSWHKFEQLNTIASTGLVAGDKIVFALEFQWEALDYTTAASRTIVAEIQTRNASNAQVDRIFSNCDSGILSGGIGRIPDSRIPISNGVVQTPPLLIASDVNSVNLAFYIKANGKAKIARASCIKVN